MGLDFGWGEVHYCTSDLLLHHSCLENLNKSEFYSSYSLEVEEGVEVGEVGILDFHRDSEEDKDCHRDFHHMDFLHRGFLRKDCRSLHRDWEEGEEVAAED